ncbi:MAG: methyl-accepting chemotaxis protein [Brevundimonas sp.]|uniref:methyl-accepting chemotaxis protein n=1 Tax=Brevundimonas sp. TaxID=1871086 RepID=UPI0027359CCB|nr:methyl-accepting chemotaxis protein [Brevundimonas sp.]MDP3406377.1 methyl-accepting chemotaxis protein [Brevundimonas sp.]
MNLSNWKIGRKLAVAFGFLALVTALIGGVGVYELRIIETARAELETQTSAAGSLRQARFFMARQENAFRGLLLTGDRYYLERLGSHRENFQNSLTEASETLAAEPDVLAGIEGANVAAAAWYALIEAEAAKVVAGGDRAAAAAFVGRNGPSDAAMAPAEDAIDAALEIVSTKREATNVSLAGSVNLATLLLIAGALASAVFAGLIGWMMTRTISTPLVSLTGVMEKLAAGNLSVAVGNLDRRDEIGGMSRSVQVFKEQAVALESSNVAVNDARTTAEQARQKQADLEAEVARQQSEIVNETAAGLSALAAGDLAHRITADFPGDYARLKSDFNLAMEKLEEAMGVIGANASAMQSGAGEISQAADDLSRRTEQQAATLEETAAALDQITATVKRTAEGAERAGTVVVGAKAAAENSGLVVGKAVAAMGEIERSSDQISQIIGVIDEIAFQTNLLALNAGVEAARAGDAGRGFAVVASEVRALAQRSAEAAKEIKGLIAASSGHVKDGVGLVGETGEALTAIVDRVAEINGLMAEITASAKEQATALSEVNTAVNQMDQTTQQNAAMVEQSTAASHNLSQEAGELAALVGKFHVSDQKRSGGKSGRGKPNPVRQAQSRIADFARETSHGSAPAPAPAPAYQPEPAPARRAAGGGAAVSLAHSNEPQWEQF